MRDSLQRSRWTPWAGFAVAPFAWIVHQQLLSDVQHFDCRFGGALPGLIAFVVLGGVLLVGGLLSWRARDRNTETSLRNFIGALGVMSTLVFGFAIALQTLATLIVPRCGP